MVGVEAVGSWEGARATDGVQNLAQQMEEQTQELVQQFRELLSSEEEHGLIVGMLSTRAKRYKVAEGGVRKNTRDKYSYRGRMYRWNT